MTKTQIYQVCFRSCAVALLVGTALNLINQGDALFSGERIAIWKILLTILILFAFSTHGALSASTSSPGGAPGTR